MTHATYDAVFDVPYTPCQFQKTLKKNDLKNGEK